MKKLFLIIIIVFAGLMVARNFIVKQAVISGVKAVTGLDLTVERITIGLLSPTIDIDQMKLLNPEGFADTTMLSVPKIAVRYDLGALLQRKVFLKKLTLMINEFSLIRNDKGASNIAVFQPLLSNKSGSQELPEMRIDVLEIKIGKVVYKDYAQKTPPTVSEYVLNIDERMENVIDPKNIVSFIIGKAMGGAGLGALAGINVNDLQRNIQGTMNAVKQEVKTPSGQTIEEVQKEAQGILKGLLPVIEGQKK